MEKGQKTHRLPSRSLILTLSIVVGLFLLFIFGIVFSPIEIFKGRVSFFNILLSLLLSSLFLLFLTRKQNLEKKLKKLLYLTGGSIVGMFVSIILHNLLYALGILIFGQHFWDQIGISDEPIFFILGVLVFPLIFLVGSIGSITMLARTRWQQKS